MVAGDTGDHYQEQLVKLKRVVAAPPVREGCLGDRGPGAGCGMVYRQMGRKGLESIENVGPRLAEVVGALIQPRM